MRAEHAGGRQEGARPRRCGTLRRSSGPTERVLRGAARSTAATQAGLPKTAPHTNRDANKKNNPTGKSAFGVVFLLLFMFEKNCEFVLCITDAIIHYIRTGISVLIRVFVSRKISLNVREAL